jgi:hypothetical protein
MGACTIPPNKASAKDERQQHKTNTKKEIITKKVFDNFAEKTTVEKRVSGINQQCSITMSIKIKVSVFDA